MANAFRCKNCGNLQTSANAGERNFPAACVVCGYGVSFDPITGIKTHHDDNWDVLADMSDDDLKKYTIDKADIETHTPAPESDPDHVPQNISVETEGSTVTTSDKAGA